MQYLILSPKSHSVELLSISITLFNALQEQLYELRHSSDYGLRNSHAVLDHGPSVYQQS